LPWIPGTERIGWLWWGYKIRVRVRGDEGGKEREGEPIFKEGKTYIRKGKGLLRGRGLVESFAP